MLFQICDIIHINGIHMPAGGSIIKMGDAWERDRPF